VRKLKQLWNSFKVTGIKEVNGKSILQLETDLSKEEILRYKTEKGLSGEIKFDDPRRISAEQRAKIFAIFKEMSFVTGYVTEQLRDILTLEFCMKNDIEMFSLSNCNLEIAKEFITFLIDTCIDNDIALANNPIEYTDDISAYLYSCIKRHACCICGSQGTLYKVGKDELKISLCSKHFDEVSLRGMKKMSELHKVYPIKIKEGD
jgi:hypothetical protein